ncbi:MAG: SusD/RagB family nutrient-binding outer membrane lipoprotein [Bacteroidota bacterium]|nr:SusD/RagB family nutrient-binding outer membrane lipoprotein [Candidatus Kapabacteria bacterium]MCS7302066.1 SusD/RagB family nutrient-binding outer membrane lipoprotein [Candidatus Kapabacteria bacterium]MCX7936866.1 SusD/RagB family nutrient-binding outer membrane lipoprotein [Chlorobiota bacterium]MDW8074585.1 SusD/RagB family nutrient-binding outer membrane lipoprotein [Bacteroidota bacterium]MDW8270939.1 SusD/RagB family nutrient-binding outer membrane lipoprotein [Bacteroidota bacteriu
MKQINLNKLLGAATATIMVVLILSGCERWVDTSLNTNPNNPEDVSMNLLLPMVEGALAWQHGSDPSRFASLFTQHHSGIDRQHLGFYSQYALGEGDVDNYWTNIYRIMNNCTILIKKAEEQQSPHYAGVARILLAYSIGLVTDGFGDVPFSEAFKGQANIRPRFDSQEQIYTAINQLLDKALQDLDAAQSLFKPGTDDYFYGGDRTKWKKAAFALKARYAIHLTKRNATAAANAALAALQNAFSSNADDLVMRFGSSVTNANPLYLFDQDRNDIRISPFFAGLLNRLNDPRRPMIGGTPKRPTDSIPADDDLGAFYASMSSPVVLLSYAEMKFIEAEARLRTGDLAGAKTAYQDAIKASMSWFGVADTDVQAYLANPEVLPSGDVTLEQIMTQKYIALYTQFETWTDWRRTGYPQLTPLTGNRIPRRFPLPQSERLFNGGNIPPGSTSADWKFTPMWWDQ